MDSKEKGMNGYTILSSHQTRQRMKARENVKRRMDILFYPHTNNETESKRIRWGDRMESSSIYIIYII